MTRTVDDLRNEIRTAVGRHERRESTGFTKEALVAICQSLDAAITTTPRPSTAAMRRAIRGAVDDRPAEADRSGAQFRKAELQAIENALRQDDEGA